MFSRIISACFSAILIFTSVKSPGLVLLLFSFLNVFPLAAQRPLNTDSLWKVYNNPAEADSNRTKALGALTVKVVHNNPDSALRLAAILLDMARKYNLGRYEGNAYGNMGVAYNNKSQLDSALKYHLISLEVRKRVGDKRGIGVSLNNIGIVYYQRGDYLRAVDFYQQSLEVKESIGDMMGVAAAYSNIGLIYESDNDYKRALQYYEMGLHIRDSIGDTRGIADSYSRIGGFYMNKKDYATTMQYLQKSLPLYIKVGDLKNLGNVIINMGSIYEKLGQKDSAFACYMRAYNLRVRIGDENGRGSSTVSIGSYHASEGNYAEAVKWCSEGFAVGEKVGYPELVKDACYCLANAHGKLGNHKEALFYYRRYNEEKDQLMNDDKSKEITRRMLQYKFEKEQLADSLRGAQEDALKEMQFSQDIDRQKTYTWAGVAGSGLMLALAFVLFRGYRQKQRSNLALGMKNQEVERQKLIVEEKNQAITDSITYARRLQQAILPPLSLWKQHLPESFVLYQPKDIVAGDFYWLEKVLSSESLVLRGSTEPSSQSSDLLLFAVADCTGHGVPGALVSVVCSNALNSAVKEFGLTDPGKILDKVTELVQETFARSESEVSDGMDISLCCLDRKNNRLLWAGANNPLWIARRGELIELKPDKQPVGQFDNRKPFTTHTVQLHPGDCIYVFSDGYADQFGGPDGKKFKYSQLRQLVLSASSRPMAEQEKILLDAFERWKENLVQVDDVCMAGVRV